MPSKAKININKSSRIENVPMSLRVFVIAWIKF
jgi:hypothetical protein